MRGVSQVLLQRCISRRSETYKTGGMGLTKTFKEFLFLHQSACTKKPCKNNSNSVFTDKVISVRVPLDSRVGQAMNVKYVSMF